MADYLVGRHKGAVEWARRKGIEAEYKEHFEDADVAAIREGDRVYGPLPIQIVAEINRLGGHYFHIEMNVPKDARGRELSADEMEQFKAKEVEYRAERVETKRGGKP